MTQTWSHYSAPIESQVRRRAIGEGVLEAGEEEGGVGEEAQDPIHYLSVCDKEP